MCECYASLQIIAQPALVDLYGPACESRCLITVRRPTRVSTLKPLMRSVAGYVAVAGAASLIGITALLRPSSANLDAWGFVNAATLVLTCVGSMVAGVRLWRNSDNAGARELSFIVLGVQVPHVVLPGFAWSITAGLNVFIGILGASLNISLDGLAFSFVRLGHHDAPFELGLNLVPLLLVLALRRLATKSGGTHVESMAAAG